MLSSGIRRGVVRAIRHIARAVLPAPRPKFSREALTLAIRYATTAQDAQWLVDAYGPAQAEVAMLLARAMGSDPRDVARDLS